MPTSTRRTSSRQRRTYPVAADELGVEGVRVGAEVLGVAKGVGADHPVDVGLDVQRRLDLGQVQVGGVLRRKVWARLRVNLFDHSTKRRCFSFARTARGTHLVVVDAGDVAVDVVVPGLQGPVDGARVVARLVDRVAVDAAQRDVELVEARQARRI